MEVTCDDDPAESLTNKPALPSCTLNTTCCQDDKATAVLYSAVTETKHKDLSKQVISLRLISSLSSTHCISMIACPG